MPARAVLWDLDGTLVDSEPLHRRTLHAVLMEAGCAPPPDLDAMLIGKSIDEVHALLCTRFGLLLPLGRFARRRAETYVALRHSLQARPGAIEIVSSLAARGVQQAIVSNSDRMIVDANMIAVGLDQFGLPTISRDDVERPKPDPEPYCRGAAALAVHPSGCIVVEDSPTGAQAGLNAGCRVIAWPEPGTVLPFDGAVRVAETPDAVATRIEAWLQFSRR